MGSVQLDSLSFALLTTIFGAAALISIRNSKGPDIHPLLLNTQSDVARVRQRHESAHFRSRMYPKGTSLLSTFDRNIRTLSELYTAAFEKHGMTPFLGAVDDGTTWKTYEDVARQAQSVYNGLRSLTQVEPRSGKSSSFVGIYALSSPDTMTVEIACHRYGLATIPIATGAPITHLKHVLRDSGVSVLFVDGANVNNALSSQIPTLKYIVVLDHFDESAKAEGQKYGVELFSLKELTVSTGEHNDGEERVSGDDIAAIYYDGLQEQSGIILKHKNLLSSISSYLLVIPPGEKITATDRLLHNLPMDNVFSYVLSAIFTINGASIVFCPNSLNIDDATDVMPVLALVAKAKPTVYASRGQFLEIVKTFIEKQYGQSFLFQRGMQKKQGYLKEGRLVDDGMYDLLIFRGIQRTLFGGQLRLIYSDNDETTPGLATFLRVVLGTQVLNVFNLNETSSTVTASMFYDYNADPHAFGAPLPCNEVKLMDSPEQNLLVTDSPNPRGEIWVRGNNVFAGYWNGKMTTEEDDGWFNTRRTGEFLPNGTLKIHPMRRLQ